MSDRDTPRPARKPRSPEREAAEGLSRPIEQESPNTAGPRRSVQPVSSCQAVRIEIEFADGQVLGATGENAAEIWKAYNDALTEKIMLRGYRYTGPTMRPIRPGAPQ